MVEWLTFTMREGAVAIVANGEITVVHTLDGNWTWDFWTKYHGVLELAADGVEPTKERAVAKAIATAALHND